MWSPAREEMRGDHTFRIQGVLRQFGFRDVDNSMDVEGDLLRVGCPAFITEAVEELAVRVSGKGVVVGGEGLFEVLTVSQGVFDLNIGQE